MDRNLLLRRFYQERISEDIELIKGHAKEIERLNNGESPKNGITTKRWKEIIKGAFNAAKEDLELYQEKLRTLPYIEMLTLTDYIQKAES